MKYPAKHLRPPFTGYILGDYLWGLSSVLCGIYGLQSYSMDALGMVIAGLLIIWGAYDCEHVPNHEPLPQDERRSVIVCTLCGLAFAMSIVFVAWLFGGDIIFWCVFGLFIAIPCICALIKVQQIPK